MDTTRRYNLTNLALFAATGAHALWTWPLGEAVALLVAPAGVAAAALAAVFATLVDALVDPNGVRDSAWEYPETPVSSPRFRGVPWWNFAAWLGIVFATAMIPTLVV